MTIKVFVDVNGHKSSFLVAGIKSYVRDLNAGTIEITFKNGEKSTYHYVVDVVEY